MPEIILDEEIVDKLTLGTAEFTIACLDCDCDSPYINREASNLENYVYALTLGWAEIEFDDGTSWWFLGVCPDCQVKRAVRDHVQHLRLEKREEAAPAEQDRPLVELMPELPPDFADAIESFKLAIMREKLNGWQNISREDLKKWLKWLGEAVDRDDV